MDAETVLKKEVDDYLNGLDLSKEDREEQRKYAVATLTRAIARHPENVSRMIENFTFGLTCRPAFNGIKSELQLETAVKNAVSGSKVERDRVSLLPTHFCTPSVGTDCRKVRCLNTELELGWYAGDWKNDRVTYASMLLGPSGGGKTYAMTHLVPEKLELKCDVSGGPRILLTMCADLADFLTAQQAKTVDVDGENAAPGDRTTAAPTVCDSRKPTDFYALISRVIAPELVKRVKEAVELYHGKKNRTDPTKWPPLYLHLVIDEIGIEPGLFAEQARFTALADAVWRCGRGNVRDEPPDPTNTLVVLGVHVSVGGTAAETPERRLASNLPKVAKIRLEPWTPEQAMELIETPRLKPTFSLLAGRSPLVRAIVSVPRMATHCVAALAKHRYPGCADPDFWHESDLFALCELAVRSYCAENGLSRLQPLHSCLATDQRLMAVGACALAAVMLQRSNGDVDEGNAKWRDAVRFAEHLGFVVCNLDRDGKRAAGAAYAYTMAPGLTLVALWLMRVPWVFLSDWSSLETLAAVQQTLRVAVACLTFAPPPNPPSKVVLIEHWPAVLQKSAGFPVLADVNGPNCILPVQWTRATAPSMPEPQAEVAELRAWFPSVDTTWTPQPLISPPRASAPDVYGHRCFVQCKFSAATDPHDGSVADLTTELRKAGLLKADAVKPPKTQHSVGALRAQRATCSLMLEHWRACEMSTPALKRLEAPMNAQRSTAGDRFAYPLCDLTQGLLGKDFISWNSRVFACTAGGAVTRVGDAAGAATVDDTGDAAGAAAGAATGAATVVQQPPVQRTKATTIPFQPRGNGSSGSSSGSLLRLQCGFDLHRAPSLRLVRGLSQQRRRRLCRASSSSTPAQLLMTHLG
jgi:hypothetical protein